jgi:predicted amidohydrolase YtcJ
VQLDLSDPPSSDVGHHQKKEQRKMHHMIKGLCLSVAVALLASCGQSPEREITADSVYVGGTILTMNPANDEVSAVAVQGGRIVAVGDDATIMATVGDDTIVVDLAGKTLLPGFIDAHGHFPSVGNIALTMVDVQSPPMGPVTTMDELLAAVAAHAENIPAGGFVIGRGYDDTLIAEQRHPNRTELDSVSTDHNIFLIHTSGHMGVGNSAMLALAGITAETPNPEGGIIEKDAETGEPTGLLKETALFGTLYGLLPAPTAEMQMAAVEKAAELYVAQGVTTAQQGLAGKSDIDQLNAAALAGKLPLRVNIFPGFNVAAELIAGTYKPESADPDLINIGAVKIIADGSIQGYTGYLGEPYHIQPDGETDYRGFPIMPPEDLAQLATGLHLAGWQLTIHGNGDAAIDDVLDAYEAMFAAKPDPDARPIIIHAQMAREDQLDRMKAMGVTPSFFSLHTYYWGDRHRDIFMGPERAFRMSPAKSALDKGVPFTIHADTPVTPMEPLRLAWSATNRVSTGGEVIGEDQRISALQALRATTIDAAWQSFLEEDRGSIEVGKRADMVILADNPLLRPDTMDSIAILETIVGGNSVYKNEGAE